MGILYAANGKLFCNDCKKLTENTYYLYNGLKRAFIENSEKVLLLKHLVPYMYVNFQKENLDHSGY